MASKRVRITYLIDASLIPYFYSVWLDIHY